MPPPPPRVSSAVHTAVQGLQTSLYRRRRSAWCFFYHIAEDKEGYWLSPCWSLAVAFGVGSTGLIKLANKPGSARLARLLLCLALVLSGPTESKQPNARQPAAACHHCTAAQPAAAQQLPPPRPPPPTGQ